MQPTASTISLTEGYKLLSEEKYSEAYEYFLPLAEKGNAEAQNLLAEAYIFGLGTEVNLQSAFANYLKSASQNFTRSFYPLGHAFYYGNGTEINYEHALEWLKKAQDAGEDRASVLIATQYIYGYGVQKDITKAIQLLEKFVYTYINSTTEQVYPEKRNIQWLSEALSVASVLLSYIYSNDSPEINEFEDIAKSIQWTKVAARFGDVKSRLWLISNFGLRDTEEKRKFEDRFRHSIYLELVGYADVISRDLETNLGLFSGSESDIDSIKTKISQMLRQDIDGAENREAIAEFWLGCRYWNGLGVEKNLNKAFELVLRSGNQGFEFAEELLGTFFLDGVGTNKNVGEAIKYLERAREKSDFSAIAEALGDAYATPGNYQNFQKSYEYYEKATSSSFAQWRLGNFRESGKGCEIDLAMAKNFYLEAAEMGQSWARLTLGIWSLLGINQLQDLSQARKLLDLIPYELNPIMDQWKLLLYQEELYEKKVSDRDASSDKELAECSYTSADYCWTTYDKIYKDLDFSENVKASLCERGFKRFVFGVLCGLKSDSSKPKIYTKELVGKKAAAHIGSIAKSYGKTISYFESYLLALTLYDLRYEAESVPVFITLAEAGMAFPQFLIGELYKTGKHLPKNYLNSYAWLNVANSSIDLPVVKESLNEVESLLESPFQIQAQSLSKQYQEKFDPLLPQELSTRSFNLFRQIEQSILERVKSDSKISADDKKIWNGEISILDKQMSNGAKPQKANMFVILLKISLLLPIVALCGFLIYLFAGILITYLMTR